MKVDMIEHGLKPEWAMLRDKRTWRDFQDYQDYQDPSMEILAWMAINRGEKHAKAYE